MKYKIVNDRDTKSILFTYTSYKTGLFVIVALYVAIFAYTSFFTSTTFDGRSASDIELSSRIFDFSIWGFLAPIAIALFNIANLNTFVTLKKDGAIVVRKQKWLFSSASYLLQNNNCQLIAKKYGWWTYYRLLINSQPNTEVSITPGFIIFTDQGGGISYIYLKEGEVREIAQFLNLSVLFK